jgi:hypothetical protein
MADRVNNSDLLNYGKDIILWQSPDKPHKSLVYHTQVVLSGISVISMISTFRVIDALGKIRYSSDHLNLAVQAYNKLYNE